MTRIPGSGRAGFRLPVRDAVTLDDLGPRICILGPSNSGKSTLAAAIGRARAIPPVHLDRFHHLPGTDWLPRAPAEFVALHDAAIAGERWVMDGNYTRCLPRRLARATGLVLLDAPTGVSLIRYLRRSWFERARHGALDGARDSVKWTMIRHIAGATRRNRVRHAALFDAVTLPKLRLATATEIAAFYRREGLSR